MAKINIEIEEIADEMFAMIKSVADGISNVLPTIIDIFKSTILELRVNAFLRDYYREQKYRAMKNSIYFCKAAKLYPELKHLALHGKKRRIRRKNIKRLYILGEFYYKNKYPDAFY